MEEGGRNEVISVSGEQNMLLGCTHIQHWCKSHSDTKQPIEIQLPRRREAVCFCRISTDKKVIQNNIPCDSEKVANYMWVDKQQTRHGTLGFRQGRTGT